jgi:RNA polymerase I-specific transcription initiation factor RRN11
MATEFLFDSFESKPARNPRKQHLKTVYDLMHLSILRRDFQRARRAWSILIRCPEFDANKHWKLGLGMILGWENVEDNDRQQQLEFLKAIMLREKHNVSYPSTCSS